MEDVPIQIYCSICFYEEKAMLTLVSSLEEVYLIKRQVWWSISSTKSHYKISFIYCSAQEKS